MLAKNITREKIEKILADQNSGIFLLDKPKGLHSFNVVSRVRKILNLKKVGFSGTLDPRALIRKNLLFLPKRPDLFAKDFLVI
jgi:hypothetical protein